MLRYAQRDTHYLLYLHGVLRKKLWDRDGQDAVLRVLKRNLFTLLLLLISFFSSSISYNVNYSLKVLDASKELCHQYYRVPQFDPDGWLKAIYRQV